MKTSYKELELEKITKYDTELSELTKTQIDYVIKSSNEDYLSDLKHALITTPFCGHPLFNEFLKRLISTFNEYEIKTLKSSIDISLYKFLFVNKKYLVSNVLISTHIIENELNQVTIENDIASIFKYSKFNHYVEYIVKFYSHDFDLFLSCLESFINNCELSNVIIYKGLNSIVKYVRNTRLLELLDLFKN